MEPILKYFPFLAGAGVLVGCWSQIKQFFTTIFHLFVVEFTVKGLIATTLVVYLNTKGKKLNGISNYQGNYHFIKSAGTTKMVILDALTSGSIVYLLKNRLVVLKPEKDNQWAIAIKVSFFRFTFDKEQLIQEAYNFCYDNLKSNRTNVFRITGSGEKQILDKPETFKESNYDMTILDGRPVNYDIKDIGYGVSDVKKYLNNYVFSESAQNIFNEVKKWKDSKEWYRERNIPWRRGALLYGLPGTGKTSVIRTIAQALDLPIYVFDLASLDNRELVDAWSGVQNNIPAIILFEDIDNIYNKRELVNPKKGPSFDCLLNCLGGALPSEGIFTFITTNKIESIDESICVQNGAILSRPGRVDVVVEFKKMNYKERKNLAKIIFREEATDLCQLASDTEGMTPAQCVEYFSKKSLESYWSKK